MFVESDIFPHSRVLILNVCNFTAVFIREVLVGVDQILTVVFYPAEGVQFLFLGGAFIVAFAGPIFEKRTYCFFIA